MNQQTQANDYVRKHNPAVIYDANTSAERLAKNKNLTEFYSDLEAKKLPQWMVSDFVSHEYLCNADNSFSLSRLT